jgi:hypothetical protein
MSISVAWTPLAGAELISTASIRFSGVTLHACTSGQLMSDACEFFMTVVVSEDRFASCEKVSWCEKRTTITLFLLFRFVRLCTPGFWDSWHWCCSWRSLSCHIIKVLVYTLWVSNVEIALRTLWVSNLSLECWDRFENVLSLECWIRVESRMLRSWHVCSFLFDVNGLGTRCTLNTDLFSKRKCVVLAKPKLPYIYAY